MALQTSERMSDDEVLSRVLYRDGLILVLNKPSGIPVHPAGVCRHNLEQYFHLLQFGLPKPPVLAHRLDLGTSGCLVLARHAEAARKMQRLFTDGCVKKSYFAIVFGMVRSLEGRIDIPLKKQSQLKNNWRMKADSNGSITAITDYVVVDQTNEKTLLKLTPLTGRTHQLRVHCAALGHPILGDHVYGPKTEASRPLYLHAHSVEIPLYDKKAPIVVEAPFPSHMEPMDT